MGGAADEGDEEADWITDGLGCRTSFEGIEGSMQQLLVVAGGEPAGRGLTEFMEFGAAELVEDIVKLGGEGFMRRVIQCLLIVIRR